MFHSRFLFRDALIRISGPISISDIYFSYCWSPIFTNIIYHISTLWTQWKTNRSADIASLLQSNTHNPELHHYLLSHEQKNYHYRSILPNLKKKLKLCRNKYWLFISTKLHYWMTHGCASKCVFFCNLFCQCIVQHVLVFFFFFTPSFSFSIIHL